MKVMSREFTRSEKVLLVILSVVLLGLLYYKFVYLTTDEMTRSLKAEAQTAQAELDIANAKLTRLEQMQSELDEMGVSAAGISDETSKMESYNNSKKETAFLNKVLSGVSDYSISFSDITRDGDQIRRSFTLQFVTGSYKNATEVVDDLSNGDYRCLVDDINYSLTDSGEIYINLTATFFETMVGGVPDSALPQDESAVDEAGSSGISIDDFN